MRDGFVVELQIAFELAELGGLGQSAEGIVAGDLGEFERGLHHLLDAFGREIRRVGRTAALRAFLASQDADSGAARAGFLQVLHFAHADADGKLLAFGDGALGIGRAAGERLLNGVGGDLFQR